MKFQYRMTFLLLYTLVLAGCKTADQDFITLSNEQGLTARFTAYGARLVSLTVPDKTRKSTNIVWGFKSEQAYRDCKTDPYYGAIIGRYGNRIARGRFQLDGKTNQLDENDHGNSLHGGDLGFHNRDWTVAAKNDSSVTFTYLSKDGEGGYPGNLQCRVTYTLTVNNALKVAYEATTDKPTVVNLTNHAYWNLDGVGDGTILRHVLRIRAGKYTPVDSLLIPLGRIDSVEGTPLDFRKGKVIGVRIDDHHAQIHNGKGYDHNFVLDQHGADTAVAEVFSPRSGIHMQVFTDQPGLQFYSGNFMAGKNTMNGGVKDNYRSGFCLETQHFPDSPNQPAFPSTLLNPGETYRSVTQYRFSHE